jgi:hypothetical protein
MERSDDAELDFQDLEVQEATADYFPAHAT